jgi:hypothetical protein|tara:strand:- start:874 stop:1770 length:897 start_codon:yes stop_codon:yes gene_type:complete
MGQLIPRIQKEKIFCNIVFISSNAKVMRSYDNYSFFEKTFHRSRCIIDAFEHNSDIHLHSAFIQYAEINLFMALGYTSAYFVDKYRKSFIRMIEDGERTYATRLGVLKILKRKHIYKSYIGEGLDEEIVEIEVQNPGRLPENIRHKGKKLDLRKLSGQISDVESKQLLRIFSVDKIKFPNHKKGILLITQPLSEDSFVSEEEKIELYKKILDEYTDGEKIYIKVHPREKTDYENVFNVDYQIIPRDFPIELFDLLPNVYFEKSITIWSGAVNNLNCVGEKVFLGMDYDKRLVHKRIRF